MIKDLDAGKLVIMDISEHPVVSSQLYDKVKLFVLQKGLAVRSGCYAETLCQASANCLNIWVCHANYLWFEMIGRIGL
jgi:hypothetical protein